MDQTGKLPGALSGAHGGGNGMIARRRNGRNARAGYHRRLIL